MKVQFIWPNFDCPLGPSVGVAYLSGALRAAGHDTRIIHISEWLDYPFDVDRVVSDVRDYGPELIAMSCGTNHYPETRVILEALKGALDVPMILGGIHATLNAREVLEQNPFLDFVGVGEGDEALIDLAGALSAGAETASIPNVWARNNGTTHANAMRPLRDLSSVPWMDLEGWPQYQKIVDLRRGWVNVYMNRGCPYRCSYCHNCGVTQVLKDGLGARSSTNEALGYLRMRGIDDMLGELKSIAERFDGVKAFSFNDDTFTMDQDHMKRFLVRYKDEIGLPFVCNTTVLDVDREMLEVMKEANCTLVRFGVESATTRIRRKVLKRDFSTRKTEEVFRTCREIGLRSSAFNILANPTETREEMIETLRLNASLRPDAARVSLGFPYPGTEYHDIAKELDLIDESRHFHNYLHDTKLKWSDADRLWIDKVRTCFWWWMNAMLGSNQVSRTYAALVEMIESLSEEDWLDPEMERQIWDLDEAVSRVFRTARMTHYMVPFKDRPDYALLFEGGEVAVKRDHLDEH